MSFVRCTTVVIPKLSVLLPWTFHIDIMFERKYNFNTNRLTNTRVKCVLDSYSSLVLTASLMVPAEAVYVEVSSKSLISLGGKYTLFDTCAVNA